MQTAPALAFPDAVLNSEPGGVIRH